MRYKLSTRFQREVRLIVDYIIANFGKRYALDFAQNLQHDLEQIARYPESSHIEPLLVGRQTEFRSKIVSKHNKVIYFIKGDVVHFTDLWDMRKNPDGLVNRIKRK